MSEHRLRVVPPLDPCAGLISALVLRCAGGERDALGTLVDLFYAPVLAAVAPQGHSDADADQVVEVFHEVWRRAPGFEAGHDPVTWILDVARDVKPLTPVPAAS
ncbi:hypothetical protein [Nocardioides sp.]|uniref:RNA polymerase sigma factor n=1 Tax=Nocardioides sp. TaxID=35761 RepID=UPI00286CCCBF|nr:hypothetical protein [Nocardioides sp.]